MNVTSVWLRFSKVNVTSVCISDLPLYGQIKIHWALGLTHFCSTLHWIFNRYVPEWQCGFERETNFLIWDMRSPQEGTGQATRLHLSWEQVELEDGWKWIRETLDRTWIMIDFYVWLGNMASLNSHSGHLPTSMSNWLKSMMLANIMNEMTMMMKAMAGEC